MSRDQIRVRVDSEQWESLRAAGEGNTELLGRLLRDWQQQRQILATLAEIDPNPSQALGRLLASHELISTAAITIQPSAPPSAEPIPPSIPTPASDLIGGLENNSDDW